MAGEEREDEARAWAEVVARWDDEEAHRAFLARFGDLEGLARAGGRYREVLAQRPGDAPARRWRDEVIRRAAVAGLAALPREPPPAERVPRWVRPAFLTVLGVAIVVLAVGLLRAVSSIPWGRP